MLLSLLTIFVLIVDFVVIRSSTATVGTTRGQTSPATTTVTTRSQTTTHAPLKRHTRTTIHETMTKKTSTQPTSVTSKTTKLDIPMRNIEALPTSSSTSTPLPLTDNKAKNVSEMEHITFPKTGNFKTMTATKVALNEFNLIDNELSTTEPFSITGKFAEA